MSKFRVTLTDARETGGWIFGTRERAEKWCEQFGNTFNITEVNIELMEISLVDEPLNPEWRVTHINGEEV